MFRSLENALTLALVAPALFVNGYTIGQPAWAQGCDTDRCHEVQCVYADSTVFGEYTIGYSPQDPNDPGPGSAGGVTAWTLRIDGAVLGSTRTQHQSYKYIAVDCELQRGCADPATVDKIYGLDASDCDDCSFDSSDNTRAFCADNAGYGVTGSWHAGFKADEEQ